MQDTEKERASEEAIVLGWKFNQHFFFLIKANSRPGFVKGRWHKSIQNIS